MDLTKLKDIPSAKIIEKLSDTQKDDIYRAIWFEHVTEDVAGRLCNLEILDEDDDIKNSVANRYVYHGDYDCNLSYWNNVDNLIYEYTNYNI